MREVNAMYIERNPYQTGSFCSNISNPQLIFDCLYKHNCHINMKVEFIVKMSQKLRQYFYVNLGVLCAHVLSEKSKNQIT